MKKLGYSLPIPDQVRNHVVERPDAQQVKTHHLKMEDWLKYLMDEHPTLLGGNHDDFEAFWRLYELQHSTHEIYSQHRDRLRNVIPVFLHGDEGRAVKRTNFFVLSFETPFGSLADPKTACTCCDDLRMRTDLPSYGSDAGGVDQQLLDICRQQSTNYKGHSYLSRFLLFGIGGWMYKKHPVVVETLVEEVITSLRTLFVEGFVTKNGATMYAACIGIKGDLEFHKKIMDLQRSYANVGTTNLKEICHLCLAGGVGVAFEDYSETPRFLRTMFAQRPWSEDNPPSVTKIPFDRNAPERILQAGCFSYSQAGCGKGYNWWSVSSPHAAEIF